MALPSRVAGEPAPHIAPPTDAPIAAPDDMPDFARPFHGTSRPGGALPARPLTRDEVHLWCEALEDWNPIYWDEPWAATTRHGGTIAPPVSMFFGAGSSAALDIGHGKPGVPVPEGVRRGLTGVGLLQSLREAWAQGGTLVSPPGCPEIAVVRADSEFYRPARPGDTLRGELRLKSCGPRKQTKLGEGHFIVTERSYFNQRNELVRTQTFTVLHYRV